ncbi:hypothetical protein [Flavobacterium sp. N3904]|uniref:hypothetical protein n=1 Tax=Flavobacterium sp. N3904 TaxID=2986835 RepID=UPI002225671F|nr:hypothetical protein [Flavobacterium sp. N3904]
MDTSNPFLSSSSIPIIYGFILYLMYVLVPLIPAFIIYKNFPDTKVGASGVWGVLSINTTGAFAAYLVVVTIGYFIILDIQKNINASIYNNSIWIVKAKVSLETKEGDQYIKCSRITVDSLKNNLLIQTSPEYNYNYKHLDEVSFPVYYTDDDAKISFTYRGFVSQIKTLSPDSVAFNYKKRTVNLGKVRLTEVKQVYDQEAIGSNSSGTFTSMPNFSNPE